MGPDGTVSSTSAFSDKVPPAFNGRSNYASFREDVSLWLLLTSMEAKRRGPALIGRLGGEAKSSAKTLTLEVISSEDGVNSILEHLDKSYAVDATNQLDLDLATFLDYVWEKSMTVEQFIAGFHARLDKIAALNIDNKLKGHLLLRQAALDAQDRNIIVGAASGKYDVKDISIALRQAYRNSKDNEATMSTASSSKQCAKCKSLGKMCFKCRRYREGKNSDRRKEKPASQRIAFYTFSTQPPNEANCRAIVDSGACASVVGKKTLDNAMRVLRISNVPDAGTAAKCRSKDNNKQFEFDVKFDVIEGDLPFLIGLPTLRAMKSSLNFYNLTMGMKLGSYYYRIQLQQDSNHLYLSLSSSDDSKGHSSNPMSTTCYSSLGNSNSSRTRNSDASHARTLKQSSFIKDGHYYASSSGNVHENQQVTIDRIQSEKLTNTKQPTVGDCHSGFYHAPDISRNEDTEIQLQSRYASKNETSSDRESSSAGSSNLSPANLTSENPNAKFDPKDLLKLHLQLKHGSSTQMSDWIRAAGRWDKELGAHIDSLLLSCKCKIARSPTPHPVVSTRVPNRDKQSEIALDLIKIDGASFLHVVCKCTGWSETGGLKRKELKEQIRVLRRIWINRHGAPLKIYGDNEYNKAEFLALCELIGAEFIPIAANDHEANGSIESANRTLRSYCRRLRSEDQKSSLADIVNEATFGKNIAKGSKLASSFELMYGKKPRIYDKYDDINASPITIEQNNRRTAQKRMNEMLRSNVRSYDDIKIGDHVYYWRDQHRWIGPALVVERNDTTVTVMHNKKLKTSSLNRVLKTSRLESIVDHTDGADEPASLGGLKERDVRLRDTAPSSSIPDEATTKPDLRNATQIQESLESNQVQEMPKSTPEARNNTIIDAPNRIMTRQQTKALKEAADRAAERDAHNALSYFAPDDGSSSTESYTTYLTDSITNRPITDGERKASFEAEHQVWVDKSAFKEVLRDSIPTGANVIGSHVIYRRKSTGLVKARIVPWGHRDVEKEFLRTDAPCMNLEVFRLVLSLAAEFKWILGEMDIKAAYLQAKGFERTIYVRPPKEVQCRDYLWQLTAAAYGLADSGRLWYLTSDAALTDEFGLSKSEISEFEYFLQNEFEVGELLRHNFHVMGCEIKQDSSGAIKLTQRTKLDELDHEQLLNCSPKPYADQLASPKMLTLYKSVLGKMLYIGRVSQPVIMYYASHMATKTSRLMSHHCKELSSLIRFSKRTAPELMFKPPVDQGEFYLDGYTDAAPGGKKDESARGGFVIFRRNGDTTHPIYWSARKLRRVARSSSTAEILSAADTTDMLSYLQHLLAELTYTPKTELTSDSRSVFSLVTSTKQPTEALNRIDIAAMREAFSNCSLRAVNWCPGYYLVADALTKDNRTTACLLLKVLRDGNYPTHPETLRKISPMAMLLQIWRSNLWTP
eukprot:IDg18277t1